MRLLIKTLQTSKGHSIGNPEGAGGEKDTSRSCGLTLPMRRMDDEPLICNELIQLGQRRNGRLKIKWQIEQCHTAK